MVCAQSWAMPAVPGAGEIWQETVPAATLNAPAPEDRVLPVAPRKPRRDVDQEQTFPVARLLVTGNHEITSAALQPLLSVPAGRQMSLSDLWQVADRISEYYHRHGYLLARAYVPAQDVSSGQVTIAVLEGRYGQVRLENTSHVRTSVLSRFLEPIGHGGVVSQAHLQEQLYLMNDVPGAAVTSVLQPSQQVGASDLLVNANATPWVSGSVGVDNWGNRYTGAWRTYADIDVYSPLQMGDHFSAYLMDTHYGDTQYGRVSYDLPVDGRGTRVGVAYGDLAYALGKNFAGLQAHGTASSSSLYLMQSLLRGPDDNLSMQVSFDNRYLNDNADATHTADNKHINAYSLAFNGDHRGDQGSMSSFSAILTGGQLFLDALSRLQDQAAYQTQGGYFKALLSANTLQGLPDGLSFYGALSAQLANKSLDPAEKMPLGGPTGVRAYPQGEALVDRGVLGSAEIRYALSTRVQTSLFADMAQGYQNQNPLPSDPGNVRSLSGLGVGLLANPGQQININTYLAWRTGPAPTSAPDRKPTVWVQLSKSF